MSHEDSHAEPASPQTAAAPAEPVKQRPLWPIAASLVIGALVGAISAAAVYRAFATDKDPEIASLNTRVDALEKRPDPESTVAGLQSSVAALNAKVAALGKGGILPATTQTQVKPTQGKPPQGQAPQADARPAAADTAGLQQKIATLQAAVSALQAQDAAALKDKQALESKVSAVESEMAGAKRETSTAQAGLAAVSGQQKMLADKVMVPALAVVADSLVQQIDQGQPYAAQVDALAGLGADPTKIAVLRQGADKGVPSAKTLAAKFEPYAEPIVATAHKAPPNAGFVDRLKSGMFSMVSIRRADDTSGTDLPSQVARIKADLAHDDVPAALTTWSALPADAKAKSETWSTLAKTSAEAMDAARALQQQAITALGAKKS